MPLSWLLFDWGGTLMSEDGPLDTPMELWPEVRAIDGAAAVLSALAPRHRIAVATNAAGSDRASIRRALARVGLDGLVTEIFCFRDLGLKKDDPRFWDAVAGQLDVPRAQLLMVGDDLDNDVLAPRRAGIASVWLNWKRAPLPAGIAVPEIERLDQLPPLLAARFTTQGTFLTAEWRNLAIISYQVAPALLEPRLPPGCVLDLRDGTAFVSLVAFDFLETRVLGIQWPGFVRFPEINLRFYIRCGERRGVCFIRELVPRRLVAWLARTLYHEPYVAARMTSETVESEVSVEVTHRFVAGGREHRIAIAGAKPPQLPPPDSVEHFFKEHDLGVGTNRRGQRLEYTVAHSQWPVHPVLRFTVDVDFGLVYGHPWAVLQGATPHSVVLATGSPVTVSRPLIGPGFTPLG